MKKIIIIAVVVLLLAGGGVAAYMLLGKDSSKQAVEGAGTVADQAEQPQEVEVDPIYLALDPAFVVNFENNGSLRYLQLSLQVMAYDQAVLDKVAANTPAVRNELIMLFSGQDYDQLNTLEGKEGLRKSVLDSINRVVKLKGDGVVQDVFFTGFVMQ